MALAIVGGGTWQDASRGVAGIETGISIRRWVVRFFPEINEKLPDNKGETIARAMSTVPAREITMEGEITAASGGVMSFAWAAAIGYVFHNDLLYGNAAVAGSIIMDEVTQSEERAGWKSLNMRLSTHPGLVV
jgi:hypothetical protein